MEELEESVCSVVQQKNEHEDQGEGVQDDGKTGTGVRCRDMDIEDGIDLGNANASPWCAELQSWTISNKAH